MSDLPRDSVLGGEVPLRDGEPVLAEFRADPAAYWRGHAILALAAGVAAGGVLVWMGNPDPWVGPLGAAVAIGLRALYLRSEAMEARWRLTPTRLRGPGLRDIPRARIAVARRFMGDVPVVTTDGDKHLMRYMGDAGAVIAMLSGGHHGRT